MRKEGDENWWLDVVSIELPGCLHGGISHTSRGGRREVLETICWIAFSLVHSTLPVNRIVDCCIDERTVFCFWCLKRGNVGLDAVSQPVRQELHYSSELRERGSLVQSEVRSGSERYSFPYLHKKIDIHDHGYRLQNERARCRLLSFINIYHSSIFICHLDSMEKSLLVALLSTRISQ